MLQRTKNFHHTKNLSISVIAVLLVACSPATETTNTPTDSASTPTTSVATSPSPQTTSTQPNIKETTFKAPSGNVPNGYFDTVNSSIAGTKTQVTKGTPITVKGWAFLVDENRIPDSVIITYGDSNSLVAVTPVNLDRVDVAKFLKNNAFNNSGWSTTFNSSILPTGTVVLKAWAYNAARKEATFLNPAHQIVVLEN